MIDGVYIWRMGCCHSRSISSLTVFWLSIYNLIINIIRMGTSMGLWMILVMKSLENFDELCDRNGYR
jgi:hypothetical protein